MKAEKIIHKGEHRIKIYFPYNQSIAVTLRQITGAKWSATYKAGTFLIPKLHLTS